MDENKPHILIVDDEIGPRESLRLILSPHYNVHVAEGGLQAVAMLNQFPVDLVTLDLKMPAMTGIDVLAKIKQHDPDIEAIIITGFGSLDSAVEGLRLDAFDYIAKPFDVKHILSLVERGLERRRSRSKNQKCQIRLHFKCLARAQNAAERSRRVRPSIAESSARYAHPGSTESSANRLSQF